MVRLTITWDGTNEQVESWKKAESHSSILCTCSKSNASPLKFRVWGQPRVFVVTNLARAGLATKRLFSPFSKLQNESDHLHYKTKLGFRPGISSVTPSPFCRHSKIDGHFVRIHLAEFFCHLFVLHKSICNWHAVLAAILVIQHLNNPAFHWNPFAWTKLEARRIVLRKFELQYVNSNGFKWNKWYEMSRNSIDTRLAMVMRGKLRAPSLADTLMPLFA